MAEAGSDAALLLPIRLRALIAEHGLADEGEGLFFEIFSIDLREIDFAELARFYLDIIANEK